MNKLWRIIINSYYIIFHTLTVMALFAKIIIWYGVIFGILDWLSDIVYVTTKEIED